MKKLLHGSLLLLLPFIAHGQQASIAADTSQMSKAGGTLNIKATVTYDERPGAMGWSIVLPPGWSLLATFGPCLPEIAPPPGSHGKVEWAFVSVPASPAQFEFAVSYPAGVAAAHRMDATMIVCSNGESKSLATNRLSFYPVTARPVVPEK